MKTLYLVRHAQAQPEAQAEMGDYGRVLSDTGTIQADHLAQHMKAQGMRPDFILSSSSVRTLQTARIIMGHLFDEEGLRVSTQFDRRLYLAGVDILIEDIRTVEGKIENLLVVGHNPGMTELAQFLSQNTLSDFTQDFGTATLAVFDCNCTAWADLSPEKMTLKSVFTP